MFLTLAKLNNISEDGIDVGLLALGVAAIPQSIAGRPAGTEALEVARIPASFLSAGGNGVANTSFL